MTTPDTTASVLQGDVEPVPPATPEGRRRRMLLLLLLLASAVAFLSFAIWYLIFRKPISEFLIPPVSADVLPTYQASYYDLTKPLGIAVASDGSRIYVTQADGSGETVVMDANGNRLGVLAPPTTVADGASQQYVAVDPLTSDVYATDRAASSVYVYGSDGTFKRRFDPGLKFASWQPMAITFDKAGSVYIADFGGAFQTVHEFDRDARLVRDFGSSGLFSFPNGVAVDSEGNLYVADSNNGRLLIFDAQGTQIGVVPRGTAVGSLGLPRGVVIDDHGHVLVVDSVGQGVQAYRPIKPGAEAPEYVDRFGTEGTVDGAFEFPNGIAVDARGRVYVADWNNDRIQVWSY